MKEKDHDVVQQLHGNVRVRWRVQYLVAQRTGGNSDGEHTDLSGRKTTRTYERALCPWGTEHVMVILLSNSEISRTCDRCSARKIDAHSPLRINLCSLTREVAPWYGGRCCVVRADEGTLQIKTVRIERGSRKTNELFCEKKKKNC